MEYRVEKIDTLQNKKIILALWQKSFPFLNGERRFAWMYEGNPVGVPDVWFIFTHDNACIGMVALCKRRFFFKEKEVIAGQAIDFVVDQSHRTLGPALQLQRNVLNELGVSVDFIYSFPNKKSKIVLKRAGFAEHGLLQRKTLIIRPGYIIKKFISNPRLSAIACWLCDPLYSLKWLCLGRPDLSIKSHVIEFNEACQQLNKIWDNRCGITGLIGDRSWQFLLWRFGDLSLNPAKCFLVLKNNAPIGYVLFNFQNKHISIVDFMVDIPNHAQLVLVSFIRYALREECDSVNIDVMNFPFNYNVFSSLGFLNRPSDDLFFVSGYDYSEANIEKSGDLLFATIADRDV